MSFVFRRLAGSFHVRLESFADLTRLAEVPDAHWVATAAPIAGLRCDPRFLQEIDADHNGRVRAAELKAAVKWLAGMLKTWDGCCPGSETLVLDHLSADGAAFRDTATYVLDGLGEADRSRIRLDQVRRMQEVQTRVSANGDGIVAPPGIADEALRALAADILTVFPGVKDRSGELGVDRDTLAAFAKARDAALAWTDGEAAAKVWGPDSVAMAKTVHGVRAKLDEYFLACRVLAAQPSAAATFQLGGDRLAALLGNTDALRRALADLPVAPPSPDGVLRWDAVPRGAHLEAVLALRDTVVTPVLGAGDGLSEARWTELSAAADGILAWADADAGHTVLALGVDRLRAIQAEQVAALDGLCVADLAVSDTLARVTELEKLVLYQRWLFEFANNFVSMPFLYGGAQPALYEQGTLVMAGRNFSFSMLVESRGAHAALAAEAYTYLMYVRVYGTGRDFEVVVPVTAGSSEGLFVGKRGIFHTLDGVELDATVVHILSNPISIKEAMLQPFTKIPRFIESRIDKWAGSADAEFDKAANASIDSAQAKAGDARAAATAAAAAPAAAAPAAVPPPATAPETKPGGGIDGSMLMGAGIAIGSLTAAVGAIFASLAGLSILQLLLGIAGLFAIIATPFGVLAWLKLRRRNMAGLLEAAGWALNERLHITRPLGLYFTRRPPRPAGSRLDWTDDTTTRDLGEEEDVEPGAKMRKFFRRFALIIVLVAVLFGWVWFKGWLAPIGLSSPMPAAPPPPPAAAAPAAP